MPGRTPSPRSGHSITVAGNKAVVFGGCGITDPDDTSAVYEPLISNETWIVDLDSLSENTSKFQLADVMGDVPAPRWRHTATLLPDDTILIFGGLSQGRRFNDTYVLDVAKMEWNIKECAGTPPHPRSHHTANLVELEPEDEVELPKQKVRLTGGG